MSVNVPEVCFFVYIKSVVIQRLSSSLEFVFVCMLVCVCFLRFLNVVVLDEVSGVFLFFFYVTVFAYI